MRKPSDDVIPAGATRIPLCLPAGKTAISIDGDSGGTLKFEFSDDGVPGAMRMALLRGKRLMGAFWIAEGNDKPQKGGFLQ
jgi:hypothetical protein